MQRFLTDKSIFFRWQTAILLTTYFVIRLFSYLIHEHIIIQGILVFLIIMTLGILYFKNPDWAWYLVLGELFLGGSGHYLEFIGLSIRTLLIGFFLFLWMAHHVGQRHFLQKIKINNHLIYILLFLLLFLTIAFFNGLFHDHSFRQIIRDLIPYSFLLLIFPSYHLFKEKRAQNYLVRLLVVFIIATAIFSLFTFTLFSSGITEVHEEFYKWYRDVNMGKITDMGTGFFRIVEPFHLLIVPFLLIINSLLMKDEKHHKMWRLLLILAIVILVLNLSRGYFLAFAIGLLVLKYKHTWKQWFKEGLVTVLFIIIVFSGIHFVSSGFKSPGWELFGVRIASLTQPRIEVSAATRMMILPEIMRVIKTSPLLGVGAGANITFLNTITYQTITTPHFDWGYLEMLAELGLLGALSLLTLYIFVIYKLITKIKNIPGWYDFDVGLLAGIIAFLIMNITAPALFHVFGILYLTFVITIAVKHTSIFQDTTVLLYRVFNRLKHFSQRTDPSSLRLELRPKAGGDLN